MIPTLRGLSILFALAFAALSWLWVYYFALLTLPLAGLSWYLRKRAIRSEAAQGIASSPSGRFLDRAAQVILMLGFVTSIVSLVALLFFN